MFILQTQDIRIGHIYCRGVASPFRSTAARPSQAFICRKDYLNWYYVSIQVQKIVFVNVEPEKTLQKAFY
jgi:hypothetical protein